MIFLPIKYKKSGLFVMVRAEKMISLGIEFRPWSDKNFSGELSISFLFWNFNVWIEEL